MRWFNQSNHQMQLLPLNFIELYFRCMKVLVKHLRFELNI